MTDETPDTETTPEETPTPPQMNWRETWQLPAALAAMVMMATGLVMLSITRPPNEYTELLEEVEVNIEIHDFDRAIAGITELESYYEEMPISDRIDFRLLRGNLFYSKQKEEGGDLRANLSQVVHDYDLAAQLGYVHGPEYLYRAADALIDLGRIDEAMEQYGNLSSTESEKRHRLLKKLVERNLNQREMNYTDTLGLLSRLLNEPDLEATNRIWGIARQAELRIEQGFVDEAIDRLLVAMQQVQADGIHEFPELFVLLGRGYFEAGDLDASTKHLNTAQSQLPSDNALRGDALLLLGQIAQVRGELDEAFASFDAVVTGFTGERSFLPAIMGRAEVNAKLDNHTEAQNDYLLLVNSLIPELDKGIDRRDLSTETVTESLITWHDELRETDNLKTALRYIQLGERLFTGKRVIPDRLIFRLARTHQELGTAMLEYAWSEAGIPMDEAEGQLVPGPSSRLDVATKVEAQNHFLDAGQYYQRRAQLLQIDDPDETAISLREAADCLDRGGDYDSAIESLTEFIRLSSNHPRQPEGIYLLGLSYQSLQDYDGAIEQFKKLLENPKRAHSLEGSKSYVPLAQCYMAHPTKPNPTEAERLLLYVIEGGARLEPDSPYYRDALIELGIFYSRAEDYNLPKPSQEYYPMAIQRLAEAIQRYPTHHRIADLHNQLAHAYRRSGQYLTEELKIERPKAERSALSSQRTSHLTDSVREYERSIQAFESVPVHKQSANERQSLKFAYLWQADATYDLGEYDTALNLYAQFADGYADDPTSLMALIQIVNVYHAKGNDEAARTAQNRAWRRLKELPPGIIGTPELPIDRERWEHMLNFGRATADASP